MWVTQIPGYGFSGHGVRLAGIFLVRYAAWIAGTGTAGERGRRPTTTLIHGERAIYYVAALAILARRASFSARAACVELVKVDKPDIWRLVACQFRAESRA
jgi:hypothetical protein